MTIEVLFLGTGSSPGVPAIGDRWGKCDPNNPKNRRLRASVFIKNTATDQNILIDTSPDIRYQFLNNNISTVHSILYTHNHSDHLSGIEEIRAINRVQRGPIDIYAPKEVYQKINSCYKYIIDPMQAGADSIYKPWVDHCVSIDNMTEVTVCGIDFKILPMIHGSFTSIGYIFGEYAYLTDFTDFVNREESIRILKESGVKTLILGVLQQNTHSTHLGVQEALDISELVQPDVTYFTHMGTNLDYDTLKSELPDNVLPAYDGLWLK